MLLAANTEQGYLDLLILINYHLTRFLEAKYPSIQQIKPQ